ncbi:MAG: nucleotidyltransferase family protein [Anaerolineae bacterium]|nr:nucleotidyltransferase family protein [Anaerolineae bacterium]
MKAIILAGGFGTRLHPLTLEYPKPMIPLANKPVLAHILKLLKSHHFSEVVITVQYLAEQIQNYFGNGCSLGLTLRYAVEERPLGTAGSIKNVQSYLDDETFLVISGDLVTDIDLSRAIRFHHQKQALATVVLKRVANPHGYGVVVTERSGRIRQYLEKPEHQPAISNMVNTGIYILEPKILDYMEPSQAYDFSYDIFPLLVAQNTPFFGYLADGYWRDIGTMQSYRQAEADILAGKVSHIISHSYNLDRDESAFAKPESVALAV